MQILLYGIVFFKENVKYKNYLNDKYSKKPILT